MANYYTDKVLDKFTNAMRAALEDLRAEKPDSLRVRISHENSKMGPVASVSLMPFLTCPARCSGTCGPDCYAAKFANLRPSVLRSYAVNTALATIRSDLYWTQVNAAVAAVRYFRFHVSGDILSKSYFWQMIDVARSNPKTEILVFTKRFELVNQWIDENGELPTNLHVLFSGWTNLTPDNPHKLPETNIIERGATIPDNWLQCGGNCFNCACRGVGCWTAKSGDTIAFKKH